MVHRFSVVLIHGLPRSVDDASRDADADGAVASCDWASKHVRYDGSVSYWRAVGRDGLGYAGLGGGLVEEASGLDGYEGGAGGVGVLKGKVFGSVDASVGGACGLVCYCTGDNPCFTSAGGWQYFDGGGVESEDLGAGQLYRVGIAGYFYDFSHGFAKLFVEVGVAWTNTFNLDG